jgi:hypothetical protein
MFTRTFDSRDDAVSMAEARRDEFGRVVWNEHW